MKRLALLFALATTTGCWWEECPDYDPPPPLASGTYQGTLTGLGAINPSTFPAAGAQITGTVDRAAGTFTFRHTAPDGGVVAETWRMRRINP
ncbi:MAG: hypothetical protein Q8S73_16220 [Deltaproteobacteria bacterium]|nr:hypothetical protein [Myxococcales bacterium]MDP3215654.1 hypothetical protein [Deltaproteobacteria bacterium]